MNPTASLAERLQLVLVSRFFARLVASPRGRAFHLSWMVDSEERDEGLFDNALLRVDDRAMHKLVQIHSDDERRHARLLRECVARVGIPPEPVPLELSYIHCIDRAAGGGLIAAARARTHGTDGIMEFYAMLQVIEERGVMAMSNVEHALRRVDPESAAVVAEIIRDEKRHVKYAQAVSRRYAPDQAALEDTLRYSRAVEARAFRDFGRLYTRFAVEHDLLAVRRPELLFWRMLVALSGRLRPDVTPLRQAA